MKIDLNLLAFQKDLKVKTVQNKKWVFDLIRKKYLVWQPEELVRQLLMHYLIQEKKYNKNSIQVEKGLTVNTNKRRFDILIYEKDTNPFMLIEVKAPSIPLNQAVFNQIAQYNLVFQVPYLLVSNGIDTYCCQMNYALKSYTFLATIPDAPK